MFVDAGSDQCVRFLLRVRHDVGERLPGREHSLCADNLPHCHEREASEEKEVVRGGGEGG